MNRPGSRRKDSRSRDDCSRDLFLAEDCSQDSSFLPATRLRIRRERVGVRSPRSAVVVSIAVVGVVPCLGSVYVF